MAASELDDAIRALYHGPLAGFVAGRKTLAKLLGTKHARRSEVVELRKPSLSAWAVNQLFAHEAAAMKGLVEAGQRARGAQGGEGGAADLEALREALAHVRGELPRLTARGAELLAASERAAGDAVAERLRVDLEALALDPAAAPVAARRWLDEDLAPPGFEVMAALQVAAAGGRPPAASTPTPALERAAAPPRPAPAPVPVPKPERPPATIHPIADARAAVAARREQQVVERAERERREREERLLRLRAELARAEQEVVQRRQETLEAAASATRAEREAIEAERSAVEARHRAREAALAASAAEAALTRAREALAREERR